MFVVRAKITSEIMPVAFDFLSQLDPGETITGQTITVFTFSGTDLNPSALISGAASPAGTIVWQNFTGGVAGTIYVISCLISTSLGQQKMLQAYLSVVDSNPYEAN